MQSEQCARRAPRDPRAGQQGLLGAGGGIYLAGENNKVIEARDYGNSPRVFLAARTFSTPIAIAAVR
jgi:hypothetical protein